jgi:hypothetical protein
VGIGWRWGTVPARRLGRGRAALEAEPRSARAARSRRRGSARAKASDEFTAAPAWGQTAGALLRLYADAQLDGAVAVDRIRRAARARRRDPLLPRGDGVDTALALDKLFPRSPFVMDESSVGSSPYDHLRRVLGRDVTGVSFSNTPLEPLPGEPYCENLRTQLYVRAAMLVHRGLVDPPADPILREEILAHRVEPDRKTIERRDKHGRWRRCASTRRADREGRDQEDHRPLAGPVRCLRARRVRRTATRDPRHTGCPPPRATTASEPLLSPSADAFHLPHLDLSRTRSTRTRVSSRRPWGPWASANLAFAEKAITGRRATAWPVANSGSTRRSVPRSWRRWSRSSARST